jgi:hypothetical protein
VYRRILNFLILFVLAGLATACFNLTEEHFVAVEPGAPKPFAVDFTADDTVYVHLPTNFRVHTDPEPEDIIGTVVFLDGEIISDEEGMRGGYQFDPAGYESGYHTMTIAFYQKTFSGSLADLLDAEAFIYSATRVLEIDNEIVPEMEVINSGVEDGTLFLEWEPYTGTRFEKYEIRYMGQVMIITDPAQTKAFIPEFAGGSMNFFLYIYAKGESRLTFFTYESDFDFIIEYTASDSLHIAWSQPPFASTTGLFIKCDDVFPFLNAFIETKEAVDTMIYLPTVFPYSITVQTSFQGGIVVDKNYTFASLRSPVTGNQVHMKNGSDLLAIEYSFSLSPDYIIPGNLVSQTVGEKVPGQLGMSHNGKQIFKAEWAGPSSIIFQKYSEAAQPEGNPVTVNVPTPVVPPQQLILAVSNDGYVFVAYGEYSEFMVYNSNTKALQHSGKMSLGYSKGVLIWLADGGRFLMDYLSGASGYSDLAVSPAPYVKTNPAYSKVLNFPHRNDYVYYDGVSKSIRRTQFLGAGSVLTEIPITGTIEYMCSNEYNDLAVLVKKSSSVYRIELYDLDTGKKLGSKGVKSDMVGGVYPIQLTRDNIFLYHGSGSKPYVMNFDFPL